MQKRPPKSRSPDIGLLAAAATLTAALLFGGGAAAMGIGQIVVLTVGLIAGFALLFARQGMQDLHLPWPVLVVIGLLVALPLVQLIPLPPEIWRPLPGRAAETVIVDLAGGAELARPMALFPDVNLQLFAALTLLIAFALTVARLDAFNVNRLLRVALAIALVQFLIGAMQFATAGVALDIFGNSHKGWLLGTFANRNHAALFFACCVLLTGALFEGQRAEKKGPSVGLAQFIFLALVVLWLLAAIGTGSRTGFALSLLAAGLAALIGIRGIKLPVWARLAGAAGLAVGVAGVMTSSRVQQLFERYSTIGDDQRWSIWQNSYDIIADYMPWGSGFGSFTSVYNKYEPISELIPTFVNNAHNDYLELLVEAGLPGAVLLGLVLVLVIAGVIRGIRSEDSQIARHSIVAGGIILLIACHSVVDYPIRRMGMAVILFFAFGLLLRQFGRRPSPGLTYR